MDWSRTKTIFIAVFFMLNALLLILYASQYEDARNIDVLAGSSLEQSLEADNIKFPVAAPEVVKEPYMSASVKVFTPAEVKRLDEQFVEIRQGHELNATLLEPYALRGGSLREALADFTRRHVLFGDQYALWSVNEEARVATLFQRYENNFIYSAQNARLTLHWNEKHQVYAYEQTMFRSFQKIGKSEALLTPLQAINSIFSRGLLKPNSTITTMQLGYSSVLQLTETQVIVPTWHFHVQLKDGGSEDFFVNAVEGSLIDVLPSTTGLAQQ